MHTITLNRMNELNEEIKNKIPILDHHAHLFASSINLIISGNYFDGYKKYREYTNELGKIIDELDFKIIYFTSCKLINEGKFNESRLILEDNIDRYNKDVTLNNNLAVVLFKLKETELAFNRLSYALQLAPNNREIKDNYNKLIKYLNLERKLLA